MRIGDWSSDVCSSDLSIKDPGQFLFDPNSAQLGAVAVAQGGRQAAWFVQGEFGRGVLRRYRRGGLMAKVSVDRYVWGGVGATRSFARSEENTSELPSLMRNSYSVFCLKKKKTQLSTKYN